MNGPRTLFLQYSADLGKKPKNPSWYGDLEFKFKMIIATDLLEVKVYLWLNLIAKDLFFGV